MGKKRVWGEERKKKYLKKNLLSSVERFFFLKNTMKWIKQHAGSQWATGRGRVGGRREDADWVGNWSRLFFLLLEKWCYAERERERERRLTISRSPITPFRETTRSHGRHDQTRHTETTTDSWEDNRPTVYTPFFIILHGIVTLSHKNVFFKRNNKMRFSF